MEKVILYLEGSSGGSGDMLLAALLDLGFPQTELKKTLQAISSKFDFQVKNVKRNGLRARQIQPELPGNEMKQWKLSDFLKLIEKSKLPKSIKEKSKEVFHALAEAEGKVHAQKPEALHFHEMGDWDTIFDCVGAVAAFHYFSPARICAGPLNVGSGFVETSHGKFPVPPPAVAKLLEGFQIYSSGIQSELVTPTYAALLAAFCEPAREMPRMILRGTGCGAGEKILPIPNVLRIFLGETVSQIDAEFILKLETNIDDMNPQLWDHVLEKLYEEGALEVYLTPVIMKKSRPGTLLTILAPLEKESSLAETLFQETTTLGFRREAVERRTLKRKMVEVETPFGKIPCKIGYTNGTPANISPEFDFLKRLSREKKIPLKKLYHAVVKELP